MNFPTKREIIVINKTEEGFIDLFAHDKYIEQLIQFGELLEQRATHHYYLYVNPLYDFQQVLEWCKSKHD